MNQILRTDPLLKEFKLKEPPTKKSLPEKNISFQIGDSVESLMSLMYSQSTGRKEVEIHG